MDKRLPLERMNERIGHVGTTSRFDQNKVTTYMNGLYWEHVTSCNFLFQLTFAATVFLHKLAWCILFC